MQNINEILAEIDRLNRESRLEEVEKYMVEQLKTAEEENSQDVALTILNEQAGYYRDTGNFPKAVEVCLRSEEILDRIGEGDTPSRAAALINAANAFRANNKLDKAYEYFDKVKRVLDICGDDSLYSSYYNNMSLLHQEAGKIDESIKCLEKALYIADEKMHDEIRTAISRTNLASSLIRMKRLDEAREVLEPAITIFEGRTPSDFHYSAALSALGDIAMFKGDIKNAVNYFEMAKAEIKLHMGENNFYKMVDDSLNTLYQMNDGKPELSGLMLSRRYYEAFGFPMLKRNFEGILDHIACGMAGEGSECLGFDDSVSTDHDFGPGFCIWVDDTVSDNDIERLKRAYSLLPKEYMGVKRLETMEGAGRVGVIRLSDYLKKATGFDHFPEGISEWQYTVDENLVLFINGEVYMDNGNILRPLRERLKSEQPYYVYFMKLAIQLENMAKYGQYSYLRAIERDDMVTALLAKADFIRASMRAMHIIAGRYAPYSKWLRRSLLSITEFDEAAALIDKLSVGDNIEENVENIEKICAIVKKSLENRGLIKCEENYLAVAAAYIKDLANRSMVADEIVAYEWRAFDKTKNVGGRANCQDDWYTFSKMRRSQYYIWPLSLLQLIYADFTEAAENGRNIITEKYGYMMESTDKEGFDEIKDKLPPVDEAKSQIIESIVAIQVSMMEDFAARYPRLAGNARVIHTSEDTPFMTSYETYLRGELRTYHPDTLTEYGRFVAFNMQQGRNIAEMTMNMTTFFYGYESLEKAEK